MWKSMKALPRAAKVAPSKIAGICRAMMNGLSQRESFFELWEISDFAWKYQTPVLWACDNAPTLPSPALAAITKAYIWWGEPVVTPLLTKYQNAILSGNQYSFSFLRRESNPARHLY